MRLTTHYGGWINAPIGGWFCAPTDTVILSPESMRNRSAAVAAGELIEISIGEDFVEYVVIVRVGGYFSTGGSRITGRTQRD